MKTKRIKEIATEVLSIALKTPFITSLREVHMIKFVRVRMTCDDGSVGIGEAPSTFVITGEDIKTIEHSIEHIKNKLLNVEIEKALRILHKQSIGSSAKAALDIAIVSLLDCFTLDDKTPIETDITISLNKTATMLHDAKDALQQGRHILKIKLGKDIRHAIEITKKLSQQCSEAILLIDANQAWSLEDSFEYIDAVKYLKIELIEQPVKAKDLQALKSITEATKIPILADEAVFTLSDVKKVMQSESADMINIKLMKCGGVSRAMEILEYARKKNITCMLGSMLEGPYSINAALYLAFNYRDVIKYIDLDSPLLYKQESNELDFTFCASRIIPKF